MRKADIKILVVEDDQTSGRALTELMKRAGYHCQWAKSPPEALNLFKLQSFDFAVMDCVLPQMNGVDLLKRIAITHKVTLPVIFLSGILRDKNFAKDVIAKTNALAFFQKPYDTDQLLKHIEDHFANLIEAAPAPQELVSTKEKMTNEETLAQLSKTSTFHGLQLPQLLGMLVQTDLSGHLNLIERNGELSSISFANGHIVNVNKRHAKSFFGVLLVEKGLASEAQIQASLKITSDKPLGERLVEAGILNPEMIDSILLEQMRIRLSEIITDTSYDVNFLPEEMERSPIQIDKNEFPDLLRDWCWSKLSDDWLEGFFRPFHQHTLQYRDANQVQKIFASFGLLTMGVRTETLMQPGIKVAEILDRFPDAEIQILKFLYYLVVQKRVLFRPAQNDNENYDEQINRLDRLYKELKGKGPFEVLGLSRKARSRDINKAYLEMAKVLHPDKLGPKAPSNLRELSQRVFALVTEAHDLIKDDVKRETYLKALEVGIAADAFRAENELARVHQLLARGQTQEASDVLSKVPKVKTHESEVRLLRLWIKSRKVATSPNLHAILAQEIKQELNLIPPEERHTALYFFVRGQMHKLAGSYDRAIVNLQRASFIDFNFEDAKKEMAATEILRQQAKVTVLDTFVGKFLGKKRAG